MLSKTSMSPSRIMRSTSTACRSRQSSLARRLSNANGTTSLPPAAFVASNDARGAAAAASVIATEADAGEGLAIDLARGASKRRFGRPDEDPAVDCRDLATRRNAAGGSRAPTVIRVGLVMLAFMSVRCVLYKSFSPIARFQHLIASPFN